MVEGGLETSEGRFSVVGLDQDSLRDVERRLYLPLVSLKLHQIAAVDLGQVLLDHLDSFDELEFILGANIDLHCNSALIINSLLCRILLR